MEEIKLDENLPTLLDSVKEKDNTLIEDIIKSEDIAELKDLTQIFNAFQVKRQILRTSALNDVQDALVEQMTERLTKQPHNFNNTEIANWMKVVQQSLDASKTDIKNINEAPVINYNQNNTQVNFNLIDNLSRESREKITEVVKNILTNVEFDNNVVSSSDNILNEDNTIEIIDGNNGEEGEN